MVGITLCSAPSLWTTFCQTVLWYCALFKQKAFVLLSLTSSIPVLCCIVALACFWILLFQQPSYYPLFLNPHPLQPLSPTPFILPLYCFDYLYQFGLSVSGLHNVRVCVGFGLIFFSFFHFGSQLKEKKKDLKSILKLNTVQCGGLIS